PEHPVGEGLQALRDALRDTHPNVRVRAVERLAAAGDPRVLPDIIDALHDQSAAVREASAAALARLGSRSAAPHLRLALRNLDEDDWVRLRLAIALSELGGVDGLDVLLDLARAGTASVMRLEALTTLIRFARFEEAVPADPDGEEAARSLERIDSWLGDNRDRLEWDAETRSYHP
ncbi:MAG: HEAT repeat domain-containing protein, partial [Acidobacteria bacterium]|nr:HEAT repeat domain-containing protein [Acidobacteriota bacterium]